MADEQELTMATDRGHNENEEKLLDGVKEEEEKAITDHEKEEETTGEREEENNNGEQEEGKCGGLPLESCIRKQWTGV